jgi:alpha-L-rhamnosidase
MTTWKSAATSLLFLASCASLLLAQQPSPLSNAQWIAAQPDASAGSVADPAALRQMPLFRRNFQLRGPIRSAKLCIAGLGQYEAHLNGHNVTSNLLTPGWSDYRKRILYDTMDVTPLLHRGANTLGVMLGNGMYNLQPSLDRYVKITGSFGQPKLVATLTVMYADGATRTIRTDPTWQTSPGPITFSSAYGGEDYDARLAQPRWDTPHFDAAAWQNATQVVSPGGALLPEKIPPVRAFGAVTPVRATYPAANVVVYDLGRNLAGWPEIVVSGLRGAHLRLIAGELLDATGHVSQASANAFLADPNAFDYTLRGGAPESWHSRFSYYGFRYVQVEFDPRSPPVRILHVDGRILHDAVAFDGQFAATPQLEAIHRLITRAMLSNLFSVLTDCPHREKLGWLEQTHLAGPSLLYNYGLAALYGKISDDMEDAQLPNGLVPSTAPEYAVFPGDFRDSPEWGSAIVLTPWTAYQFYGDLAPLHAHYASMRRYAAYLKSKAQDGLLTYGLGDWYDIGPGEPGYSKLTTSGVTATATWYELLTDLARIANLLEHPEDAADYTAQAAVVRQAFNRRFFNPATNEYDKGTQTANAMPLVLGLAPEDRRPAILANLVADIRAHQNHVTAGDIGFHYVVRALTDGDRSDVLYDMLRRTDSPSYGFQLAHGATTLTEAWDAHGTSSQNHFMLGAAEEWFYRGLAGIDVEMSRPANARVALHPAVLADLPQAGATFHSTLGTVRSAWRRTGNTVRWTFTLPTAATVTLPLGYTLPRPVKGVPAAAKDSFLMRPGTYTFILVPGKAPGNPGQMAVPTPSATEIPGTRAAGQSVD